MILTVPDPVPARDLESVTLTHGGKVLEVCVQRRVGVKKDGELRTRLHRTTYFVEAGDGCVRLTRADGAVYTVTAFGCDCKDAQFQGRVRACKHAAAVVAVGLLKIAEGA